MNLAEGADPSSEEQFNFTIMIRHALSLVILFYIVKLSMVNWLKFILSSLAQSSH